MDTKLKADIAESAVVHQLLSRGFNVLKPYGDRLPYDLAVDINGKLIRIQVKCAWFDKRDDVYIVDSRRTKTNRRVMLRARYKKTDFDLAIVYLPNINVFYILPFDVFDSFGSSISFVEATNRQRVVKTKEYRECWDLLCFYRVRCSHVIECAQ